MIDLHSLRPGDAVVYTHEARGGYGYYTRHLARVVRVGAARITVEMQLAGRTVRRSVSPQSLSYQSK